LIPGNDSAGGKDQHGHYKGPELEFLAVTERMRVIGRLSASMKTVQQQGAVSRVANRVHAFGKHRGVSTENAAVNFQAVMITLAPMATRIAIGFWSIAQRVTAMNYMRRKCLPRKNSVLR
jgi:hypothetical protein